MIKTQKLTYKKYPGYYITKYVVRDRWGRQPQYIAYFKGIALQREPYSELKKAKIAITDHFNLTTFYKQHPERKKEIPIQ